MDKLTEKHGGQVQPKNQKAAENTFEQEQALPEKLSNEEEQAADETYPLPEKAWVALKLKELSVEELDLVKQGEEPQVGLLGHDLSGEGYSFVIVPAIDESLERRPIDYPKGGIWTSSKIPVIELNSAQTDSVDKNNQFDPNFLIPVQTSPIPIVADQFAFILPMIQNDFASSVQQAQTDHADAAAPSVSVEAPSVSDNQLEEPPLIQNDFAIGVQQAQTDHGDAAVPSASVEAPSVSDNQLEEPPLIQNDFAIGVQREQTDHADAAAPLAFVEATSVSDDDSEELPLAEASEKNTPQTYSYHQALHEEALNGKNPTSSTVKLDMNGQVDEIEFHPLPHLTSHGQLLTWQIDKTSATGFIITDSTATPVKVISFELIEPSSQQPSYSLKTTLYQSIDHPSGDASLNFSMDIKHQDSLHSVSYKINDDTPWIPVWYDKPVVIGNDSPYVSLAKLGSTESLGSFGADGGYIDTLILDKKVYKYDDQKDQVYVDGHVFSDYCSQTKTVSIPTASGEQWIINMRSAEYSVTKKTVDHDTFLSTLEYHLRDFDGDSQTVELNLYLSAPPETLSSGHAVEDENKFDTFQPTDTDWLRQHLDEFQALPLDA